MNKQITYFSVILLILITGLTSCNTQVKDKIDFANNKVVAHRGAWKQKDLPQNSIASLKHAIELKCTGSEFDVRMTADSVLIINHDEHYNDMPVEETNYVELAKIKLSNGETLPTLKDYILAGMDNNTSTGLVCEIKPSKSKERGLLITEKIIDLVKELHAQPYILSYISFDYDILKKIKDLDPDAKTQYLDGSKSPEELKVDGISGLDYYMWAFKSHPEWIENAKKENLILNAWTVNERDDMEFFLGHDFDYITTNEPELLLDMEQSKNNWNLVWSDEFEGDSINPANWNFVLWKAGKVNNEWQEYIKDTSNYKVNKGKLYITARKIGENEKGGYTSTRLNTKGKKEFKYGRIEFRAKMPHGRGVWPALWMLGSNHDTAGWPLCGEIDVLEYVGYMPDTIHCTIHTKFTPGRSDYHAQVSLPTVETEFHNYGIIWDENQIQFYLDTPDNIINTNVPKIKDVENWPFDQPFYLIINFAVGGGWGGRQGVDGSVYPQTLVVDYVRVYEPK